MQTNKCFTGLEAEGPYRGKNMLFVPGCVGPNEFMEAWKKVNHRVDGIYFGAGGYRKELNPETFKVIRGIHCTILMVETQEKNGDIMVYDMRKSIMHYKNENPLFIEWDNEGHETLITFWDDPHFATDKEVE
jgi:hypothetical protein